MDFNLDLCPAKEHFNYIAKNAGEWSSVQNFLKLTKILGHSEFCLKITDDRAMAMVVSPEHIINLARRYEFQGKSGMETPYISYYKSAQPITVIQNASTRVNAGNPVILIAKTNHLRVKFLLIMLTDDFYSSANILADQLRLDYTAAFDTPRIEKRN